ncbi:hypothetical protein VPNG_05802 [Cytospora leucostoma]|uniref:tRNA-intron lyase n=1 Tax=Cytospora leucostoma TaxID=1230097 RepID=A0A423X066_9PEZI|nr:hypothetical protein VPNG_05802 [Cytospora leucostoma]
MAEVQSPITSDRPVEATSAAAAYARPPPAPKGPRPPSPHQIYKQPAPLRVFPYPSLTTNPVSLVHLAVTWLSQLFYPPSEPSIVHVAYWDNDSRTINITDEKSMVDLWQQGFFGKGSLSRSEPNWLKREKTRLGLVKGRVSEVETNKRRAERNRVKWERARVEQEALEQKRLEEAKVISQSLSVEPPRSASRAPRAPSGAPVGPLELLALPNSQLELSKTSHNTVSSDSGGSIDSADASRNGSSTSGNDDADSSTTISEAILLKRPKSVRFSPTVEATEFLHTDPPRPARSVSSSSLQVLPVPETSNDSAGVIKDDQAASVVEEHPRPSLETEEVAVTDKEHLQILPEEALFLNFSLGALNVVDSATKSTLSTKELFALLRRNSYSPPRLSHQSLQPDDPFLIHYAVYHHFRSLGWVPRAGIKFGVDWLLYFRGPVFDHAEYGLLILPSYSDPYWKSVGKEAPRKSWHWFMGVNRVLSKVFKRLVLVYVDIPPPTAFEEDGEPKEGIVEVLKQYKVREVMIKRWSSNRNRD